MINKQTGYTLIELIMTVALLVIVLTAGTAIFYRSFQSSGLSDIQATVNNDLNSLSDAIDRNIRFAEVVRVDNNFRTDCLNTPGGKVVGSTLVVDDFTGGSTAYSLSLPDGKVSSTSANPTVLNSPDIQVTKLEFTWYCKSGVNDKINIDIEAKALTTAAGSTGVLNKEINLLNSGIN